MTMRTHILDVGRGDCIIIELPNRSGQKAIGIIDCCNFDIMDQYMIDNRISPDVVEFVVATHPHEDHIGGIQEFLTKCKTDDIDVKMFWDSGYEHSSLVYQNLTEYLANNPEINTWYPRTGLSVLFDKVKVRVLSPPDPLPTGTASDINNSSIVLLFSYGTSRLLFAGDAQFANWAHINVDQQDWMNAQVLKVAHHGSKHGTFLEALEAITPRIAIISGANSVSYGSGGFPHHLTIDALLEEDVPEIYCTHDCGNIIIDSKANRSHKVTRVTC